MIENWQQLQSLMTEALSGSVSHPGSEAINMLRQINEGHHNIVPDGVAGVVLDQFDKFRLIKRYQFPDFATQTNDNECFISSEEIHKVFISRFGEPISPAECSVLQNLLCGISIREMSADQDVSYQTRRNQVTALRNKSGFKRHTDLVQIMSVLLTTAIRNKENRQESDGIQDYLGCNYPGNFRTYRVSVGSGRILRVLDIGDEGARPVIYMHGGFFPVFPLPHQQHSLLQHNLRVLIPLRPGYFEQLETFSNPLEQIEQFAKDICCFLQVFNLGGAPILSYSSGVNSTVRLLPHLRTTHKILITTPIVSPEEKTEMRILSSLNAWRKIVLHNPKFSSRMLAVFASRYNSAKKLEATFNSWSRNSPVDVEIISKIAKMPWFFELQRLMLQEAIHGFVLDRLEEQRNWTGFSSPKGQKIQMLVGAQDPTRQIDKTLSLFEDKVCAIEVKPDFAYYSPMVNPDALFERLLD